MDRRSLLLFATLSFAIGSRAQTVLDGAYIREHVPTRRPIPYVPMREADVMFAQRVWRVLDLREKINLPLYYPLDPVDGRKSLFDVIRDALLKEGSLTAYDIGPIGQDDHFTKALSIDQVDALLNPTATTTTEKLDGSGDTTVTNPDPVRPATITQYMLKEDWLFDRQRGTMDVRIIGLAPMKEVRGEDGELRGHTPLFWLYFPELRYILANAPAFNRWNDAERASFDQLFRERSFGSYVTKVSNVYGRSIAEYSTGVDALLEGERVKQALFEREHDLWNF